MTDHQSLEIVGNRLEAVELRHLPFAGLQLQFLPFFVLPDSFQPLLLLKCLHLLCILRQLLLNNGFAAEEVDGEVDEGGAADSLGQASPVKSRHG